MTRFSLFVLSLLYTATTLSATTADFTPKYEKIMLEGMAGQRPYFSIDEVRWSYYPPSNTKFIGSAEELKFTVDAADSASFIIRLSPLTPELPLEAANLDTYRAAAQQTIWSSATDITLLEENMNPYPTVDMKGHEFLFSYNLPGESLKQGIAFLNFNEKVQLMIIVTARKADYDKVRRLANLVINSLTRLTDHNESQEPVEN